MLQMLHTVRHEAIRINSIYIHFPGRRIMCAGKVLFPMDQTGFLLLLRKLSGEFKLKIYWKCVELNTLYCSDETVLLVLKCNSKH